MDTEEQGIHPLDRDYTAEAPETSRLPPAVNHDYHARLRRYGLIGFAAGFIAVFLGGVMVSNFQTNTFGEWFGSLAHRLGMITILLGASTVMVAYQWDRIQNLTVGGGRMRKRRGMNPLLLLILWNAAAMVAVTLFVYLSSFLRLGSMTFLITSTLFTVLAALTVTMIVWHRGFLRAYAIGVLIGLVINLFSGIIGFNTMRMRGGQDYLVFGHLLSIVLSGLACAAYVYVLEGLRSRAQAAEDGARTNQLRDSTHR